MAVESGWQRREPLLQLDAAAIAQLIGAPVLRADVLSGGLRNTNYKVELADRSKAVLRLFTSRGRGLDAREDVPCAREDAVLRLIADTVPVPQVFSADASADPAWILMEFVDGDRFDLALQGMSDADVQQASASAGAALARIHDFGFERAGLFGPGLEVVSPMGGSWLPMVERGMSDGGRPRERVGAELADRLLRLIDAHGHRLEPQWSQARLLHCDYKPWNMLARQSSSGWHINAVLDWEFAAAGPPLCDFGIYLRYADRHPSAYTTAFVDGYRDAGGTVPDDAARLCRLVDLVNVCTFLERPEDDAAITQEMQRVILATLEAFNQ